MEDKLDEAIARSVSKKFVPVPPFSHNLELISFKTFDESDKQAVRDFQAAILKRLNVRLVVIGGSYGCTKLVFSLDGVSPEEARIIIQDLLESEIFREEALKVDFQIAIARNPNCRVDLRRGTIESQADGQGILLFYSYAHEDEKHRETLDKHLSILKKQGFVRVWHDRKIVAGTQWEDEIDKNLEYAAIVLLLISVDFLASEYCYSKEMSRALARHDAGEARVIPVIVRPSDWEEAPFAKLQVLPENGQAVTSWKDQEEAWVFVAKEVRRAIQNIKCFDSTSQMQPNKSLERMNAISQH